MTLDYRSHLADWLRGLKLSEPEIDLTIPDGTGTRKLLLAFPEFRFGIWEDSTESGNRKSVIGHFGGVEQIGMSGRH